MYTTQLIIEATRKAITYDMTEDLNLILTIADLFTNNYDYGAMNTWLDNMGGWVSEILNKIYPMKAFSFHTRKLCWASNWIHMMAAYLVWHTLLRQSVPT